MEKNKPTRPSNTDPNKQVHSEFETTEGNNFEVVREEAPKKKKKEGDADLNEPLNELPPDEGEEGEEGDKGDKVDRG
jgi:hypothetical protein